MQVALVQDNCSLHGLDAKGLERQIEKTTMPPSCTTVPETMDMDVLWTWETLYCSNMLLHIAEDLEFRQKNRLEDDFAPADMKDLGNSYDPHWFQVTVMVKETWNLLTEGRIARCWLTAHILQKSLKVQIGSLHEKFSKISESCEIQKLT